MVVTFFFFSSSSPFPSSQIRQLEIDTYVSMMRPNSIFSFHLFISLQVIISQFSLKLMVIILLLLSLHSVSLTVLSILNFYNYENFILSFFLFFLLFQRITQRLLTSSFSTAYLFSFLPCNSVLKHDSYILLLVQMRTAFFCNYVCVLFGFGARGSVPG